MAENRVSSGSHHFTSGNACPFIHHQAKGRTALLCDDSVNKRAFVTKTQLIYFRPNDYNTAIKKCSQLCYNLARKNSLKFSKINIQTYAVLLFYVVVYAFTDAAFALMFVAHFSFKDGNISFYSACMPFYAGLVL